VDMLCIRSHRVRRHDPSKPGATVEIVTTDQTSDHRLRAPVSCATILFTWHQSKRVSRSTIRLLATIDKRGILVPTVATIDQMSDHRFYKY
jgi:hypothetical protein